MDNIIMICDGDKSIYYQVVSQIEQTTPIKIASYLSTISHPSNIMSNRLYETTGVKIIELNVLAEYKFSCKP